ncbi:MAG TPA: helix-turn-helix domain-containing protein, partial [Saprospiraceae bacterium]|nr:helix-turn-helix domain-containing protein [Saprospiraceae bacterium]
MLRVKNLIENYQIRKKYTLNEAINISDIEEKGIGSHYINLEQKLENYIIENLSNANLSSNQIADSFSMNKAEFQKLVKKLTGMTPAAYLDEVRFNKARIHLETNPGIQIKEVAFIFGFKKAKDFTDSYYKHYGKYPSEYHEY